MIRRPTVERGTEKTGQTGSRIDDLILHVSLIPQFELIPCGERGTEKSAKYVVENSILHDHIHFLDEAFYMYPKMHMS